MFFTTISTPKKMRGFFSERAEKGIARHTDASSVVRTLVIFDWFVLSMRMQVILDSPFARPGSAPIGGGKKGEFRDWTILGIDCQDIVKRGQSHGDGLYLLDSDGGSQSNAFLAYCDMTSYNGGWTMCYTTDEYVKPKTEVTYSAQFPYGSDGYRTNCNNISVS